MNEVERVKSLILGIQFKQPRLYAALSEIAKALDKLDTNIEAVTSELRSIPLTGLAIAPNVTVFNYTFTRRNVLLSWAQPDTSIFAYEIRKGGSSWETASIVLTSSTLNAVFDPLLVGTTTYWIKGIDFDGNYSAEAKQLDVIVPPIGVITLSGFAIDNNVLFQWSEPTTTFDIDYYLLTRDSTIIGKTKGTFAITFESVGGTFEYKIKAVDIAGNISPETSLSVEVRQPPDFDLLANGIDDLSGIRVNVMLDSINMKLIANVNMCGV